MPWRQAFFSVEPELVVLPAPTPGRTWDCGQGAQVWKEGPGVQHGVVGDSSKW